MEAIHGPQNRLAPYGADYNKHSEFEKKIPSKRKIEISMKKLKINFCASARSSSFFSTKFQLFK